jgi:hypothetical protein
MDSLFFIAMEIYAFLLVITIAISNFIYEKWNKKEKKNKSE